MSLLARLAGRVRLLVAVFFAGVAPTAAAVARVAPSIPRCQCAESHLSICGLRAHGGILSGPTVAVWVPGRPASPAMTLPRRCSFPGRLLCGLAMFDTPPAMTCL